jgi:AcrR family transcriptional regulator
VNAHLSPGPRQRLLVAAERLTYTQGAGVGVGALLQEAGVARRSLYEHFGGKAELVAEVLRGTAEKDLESYRTAMDRAGTDPAARIAAIFDHLDGAINTAGFRGCRYLGADLALQDPGHPAHEITRTYRANLTRMIRGELERLGSSDVTRGADQIMFLIEGTLAAGATMPDARPALIAGELAQDILTAIRGS